MSKKLSLDVDELTVETFATAPAEEPRGTVEAHATPGCVDDCTYFATCLCKTNYYQCGTGPHTIYSCNYTNDWRCTVDAVCTS